MVCSTIGVMCHDSHRVTRVESIEHGQLQCVVAEDLRCLSQDLASLNWRHGAPGRECFMGSHDGGFSVLCSSKGDLGDHMPVAGAVCLAIVSIFWCVPLAVIVQV